MLILSYRSVSPSILGLFLHGVIDGRTEEWEEYSHILCLVQDLDYSHMVLELWNQRIYIFRGNWKSIYGKEVKSDGQSIGNL